VGYGAKLIMHLSLAKGGSQFVRELVDHPGIMVTDFRETRDHKFERRITYNGNTYETFDEAVNIWKFKQGLTEEIRRNARKRKGDSMAKRVFKKTKKMSGGPKTFRAWKEWAVGDYVIGKYVGTHEDQYQKTCRIIEIVDGEFAKKGAFKKVAGQNLVLNAAGQIDAAFEDKNGNPKIAEGEMVQVMYNGTSQITKGKFAGKDAHLIEVDLVEEEGDESEEDEDLDEEEDQDEDEESDEDDEDEESDDDDDEDSEDEDDYDL
jgi:hypothetical protein